jgi:hypothetical protein
MNVRILTIKRECVSGQGEKWMGFENRGLTVDDVTENNKGRQRASSEDILKAQKLV